MRVSREQAAANRERIVETASRLFRERGLDGAGVDEIMKEAGLTHGGFYGHFASKEALADEALAHALKAARAPKDGPNTLARRIDAYLNESHLADRARGCPVAALAGELPRWDQGARRSMAEHLRDWFGRVEALLGRGDPAARRRRAIATVAGMVGALTLARAVDDEALAGEILAAARETFGGSAASKS